ncbi:MAG: hypothetical protein AAGF10_00710 [Verrucomicrobiota bacterium]
MEPRCFFLAGTLLLCLLLQGCNSDDTFAHPPPAALDGEWFAADGTYELSFLPNNRFSLTEVREDGDATRLTGWAYYPRAGQVSFEFDQRLNICPEIIGVYTYTRDADTLTFLLVQDDCEVRTKLIPLAWSSSGGGWF